MNLPVTYALTERVTLRTKHAEHTPLCPRWGTYAVIICLADITPSNLA